MSSESLTDTAVELLEQMPKGVIVTDSSKQPLWANPAMLALCGLEAGDFSALDAEQLNRLQQFATPASPLQVADSWFAKTSLALSGELTALIFEDISELQQLRREQQANQPLDKLTGLPGETAIYQGLKPLISLCRRYSRPLALVMVEVGGLDQLDSDNGPNADELLVAVSHQLKEQTRWADLIGRYGENRFILVLPETDKQAATKLVEKLLPALCRPDLPELTSANIELPLAFGITEYSMGDSEKRLIARASEAVAVAKKNHAEYAEVS